MPAILISSISTLLQKFLRFSVNDTFDCTAKTAYSGLPKPRKRERETIKTTAYTSPPWGTNLVKPLANTTSLIGRNL
jgi:hypothetical protein